MSETIFKKGLRKAENLLVVRQTFFEILFSKLFTIARIQILLKKDLKHDQSRFRAIRIFTGNRIQFGIRGSFFHERDKLG